MRAYLKRNLLNLMTLVSEGMGALSVLEDEAAIQLLIDIQDSVVSIGTAIEQESGKGSETLVTLLEHFAETLYHLSQEVEQDHRIAPEHLAQAIQDCDQISTAMEQGISLHYEVVFMPYNASMWDSLESIYLAAAKDPSCHVVVMPIPYYNISPQGQCLSEHYEADLLPPDIPVTDYRQYSIEETFPDAIFIHNPYDSHNLVTQVPEAYFSSELKAYTDRLIYIPYKVCRGFVKDIYCNMPGVTNAWRVFVQSEGVRQTYLRYNPAEKIVALGSPKVDKVVNCQVHQADIPKQWQEVVAGKKLFLYNTHLNNIVNNAAAMIKKIRYVCSLFEGRDDIALLWRPHPLSIETAKSLNQSILHDYLQLIEDFKRKGFGIYDDSSDVHRAMALADAYIGDWSSLVSMFGVTGKPILVTNVFCGPDSLLDRYLTSIRASACFVNGQKFYFTSMGSNELFMYDMEQRKTQYLGRLEASIHRQVVQSKHLFQNGEKLMLSGGAAFATYGMFDLKDGSSQIVAQNRTLQSGNVLHECLWQNRVYVINRELKEFGYIDFDTKDFVNQAEVLLDAVYSHTGSVELQVMDWCLKGDILTLLLSDHMILQFDLLHERVGLLSLERREEEIERIGVLEDGLILLTRERKIYRTDSDGKKWKLITNLETAIEKEQPVGRLYCDQQWIVIVPLTHLPLYKINLETGQWKTLKYPFDVKFDSDDIKPSLPRFSDWTTYEGRLLLCPTTSSQLLSVDLEHDTISGVPIPIPGDWDEKIFADHMADGVVFVKSPETIYYEVWFGLSRYIQQVLQGEPGQAQKRKEAFSKIFANIDGSCGSSIWQYVRNDMEIRNKKAEVDINNIV